MRTKHHVFSSRLFISTRKLHRLSDAHKSAKNARDISRGGCTREGWIVELCSSKQSIDETIIYIEAPSLKLQTYVINRRPAIS